MKRIGVLTVGGLALAGLLLCEAQVARAELDAKRRGSTMMCNDPVSKRWNVITPSSGVFKCQSKWRYQRFSQYMQGESVNLFRRKRGWNIFQGRSNHEQEKAYFIDSLSPVTLPGNRAWFRIWWVEYYQKGPSRASLGVYLYKVPNAADLIAKSMPTNAHYYLGHSRFSVPAAHWALWYLGGKKHADTLIRTFTTNRGGVKHTNFTLTRIDRWKLSKAQIGKIESFCLNKVFQPGGFESATRGCLRYLGRVKTRSSQLKQFLVQHAGTSDSTHSIAAIRSLGYIGHKGIKRKLLAKVAQAKKQSSRLIKRGRRYIRKPVVTYSTHFNSPQALVALIGLGDRKAMTIVKDWVMTYDKRDFIDNNTAFEAAYREGPFASSKAYKKLRGLYKKGFKRALKALRKNPRMKSHVRFAAVSLLQMGDKTGLKHVIQVLNDSDKNEIKDVLLGLGANPTKTWGGRSEAGIGQIKVGKGGLKVKDAQRLVKTIRSKFMFWRDNSIRWYAIQAIADIEAQILIAKKRL